MYAVDLGELLATVDALDRCGADLGAVLSDVADRVAALHGSWSGRAATAQVVAQAEWESGFREMQAGVAAMRAATSAAHDRYDGAVSTNLRMWEQVP